MTEPKTPSSPTVVRGIATILLLAMGIAIGLGVASGENLLETLREWLADPWGRATLVDLYAGFVLFTLWIAHRERSLIRTGAWFLGTCCLGNVVPCIYLLVALKTSGGDPVRFWHGKSVANGP